MGRASSRVVVPSIRLFSEFRAIGVPDTVIGDPPSVRVCPSTRRALGEDATA